MRVIWRAPLLAVGLLTIGCGSSNDTGGSGTPDASLDTAHTPDASEDRTTPNDSGSGAREAGGQSDTGTPGDAASDGSSDASSDVSDAAEADVYDSGITFGDPICTPHSGTRIKLRWYQGTEGTRIFDSMYDSMLNAKCIPAMTSDGTLRCLPLTTLSYRFSFFSDMGCSTPLFANSLSCGVPAYEGILTDGTCLGGPFGAGGRFAMYQVGAEQPDGGATWSHFSGGTCGLDFYSGSLYAVVPVPDSTFVTGVVGQATVGRYSMRTVQFSDGALLCDVYYGFYDSMLDVLTSEQPATDNTTRLFPEALPASGFSEGTCTTPATLVKSDAGCPPNPINTTAFTTDTGECAPFPATIRSVGATVDGGFAQDQMPDGGVSCMPVLPSDAGTWNALSAPLPPSTFGQTFVQNAGTGRLQYIDHAAADGFRWRYSEAFDTQTMKICSIVGTSDPTTPCIPFEYQAFAAYSDSKCMQPISVITLPASCSAPPPGTTAWIPGDGCPTKVLHVGTPYTGTVYQGTPASCSPASFSGQVVYQCVDDIDPASFEQMSVVIE